MYDTMKLAQEAILRRLSDNWTSTEIAWKNRDFKQEDAAFIRPRIIESGRGQRSLGSSGARTFRTFGVFIVQVFSPTGEGQEDILDLVDKLVTLFEGVQLTGALTFRGADSRDLGVDGKFTQYNVSFPFYYDTQK